MLPLAGGCRNGGAYAGIVFAFLPCSSASAAQRGEHVVGHFDAIGLGTPAQRLAARAGQAHAFILVDPAALAGRRG